MELTNEQWAKIAPLLTSKPAVRGRRPVNLRNVVNGILWVCATNEPWVNIPKRLGSSQTTYRYYTKWVVDGTWDKIYRALHNYLDREHAENPDYFGLSLDEEMGSGSEKQGSYFRRMAHVARTNRNTYQIMIALLSPYPPITNHFYGKVLDENDDFFRVA